MPGRASGYQAYSGLTVDPSMHDGNDVASTANSGASTGFEVVNPGSGVSVSATGVLDLGPVPGTAIGIRAVAKWAGNPAGLLEYNTTLGPTGWTVPGGSTPSLINGFGAYNAHYLTWTFSGVAPRYWRLSFQDTEDGNGSARVGLMELWAVGSGGTLTEYAGGTPYTDAPQAKAAGKAGIVSEAQAAVDAPSGHVGERASLVVEVYIPSEAPASRAGLAAGGSDVFTLFAGGTIYGDTPRAGLGLKAAGINEAANSFDAAPGLLGLFLGVVDVKTNAAPVRYNDVPRARLGFVAASVSDVTVFADTPGASAGNRAMALADAAFVDAPAASVAGKAAVKDGKNNVDAGQAKGAAKASTTDRARSKDFPSAKAAAKASIVAELYNVNLHPQSRAGIKIGDAAELATFIETISPLGKAGMRAGGRNILAASDAPAVKAGAKAHAVDRQIIHEIVACRVGARGISVDSRTVIEKPGARVSMKAA
jgi:hypothetical protein